MNRRTAPRLLFAATSDESLLFLDGFPAYLRDRGWDVHVVSDPGPRLERAGRVPGVTAHALPMRRNPAPLADLLALFAWLRLLGRVKPDIVFAGTPKASLLAVVAAAVKRTPVRVYHVLGLRLESATGAGRRLLKSMELLTSRCATHVLAVSPSLADALAREGVVDRDRVAVLGAGSSHGVDAERFSPEAVARERAASRERLGLLPDDVLVGFVGRLNADKGLEALAGAIALLGDLTRLHFVIVGEIDRTNAADTATLSSAPRVHVVGAAADPLPFYAAMDLLCLPTLREGMPNVVLEASACEIPVVTTDATGAVDSVVADVTGLVVPVGDARALAAALRRLALSPDERARLGKAGRSRMVSDFARDDVWSGQEAYLRKLLGTAGPA